MERQGNERQKEKKKVKQILLTTPRQTFYVFELSCKSLYVFLWREIFYEYSTNNTRVN